LAKQYNLHALALINLGVNDWLPGLPNEVTWKANYQTVIDALVAKWPAIHIYIAKSWNRGYDASAATVGEWIDDLITANPGVVFAGHNEQVWLKGADDGATMTIEGIHYSVAGYAEAVNQWKTALGY
jgi:hypothetical protein